MKIKKPDQRNKHVLVTSFKPFHHYRINPSEIVVRDLQANPMEQGTLMTHVLDVSFDQCRMFVESMQQESSLKNFHAILMLGLNAKARCLLLERIAINLESTSTADENGECPIERRISTGSPDGIFSNLPVLEYRDFLRSSGFDCQISNCAGTYVCNSLFYRMMLAVRGTSVKAGFIHLPSVSRQWPQKKSISAIRLLLKHILQYTLEM